MGKIIGRVDDEMDNEGKDIYKNGNRGLNKERGSVREEENERPKNNGSELVVGKLATTNSTTTTTTTIQWQVSKLPPTHLYEYDNDIDLVGKLSAYLTNSEDYLGVLREIKDVVEYKKTLKATIFLFLIRHKVIYRRLFGRYFETINHGSLVFCINDLINKHFIYKIENGSSPHEKERKDIENVLKHNTKTNNHNLDRIVWYGITGEAQDILPPFLKAFLPIIPDDIRKRIMDPTLKSTFRHTHVQLKHEELAKQKEYNFKLREVCVEISQLRFGNKKKEVEVYQEIYRKAQDTKEDRMTIAERMLEECKEMMKSNEN